MVDGQIKGKDGVCLNVLDGNFKTGVRRRIQKCDGWPEQKWEIVNAAILPNGATKDGTPIQTWTCDGGPDQDWKW